MTEQLQPTNLDQTQFVFPRERTQALLAYLGERFSDPETGRFDVAAARAYFFEDWLVAAGMLIDLHVADQGGNAADFAEASNTLIQSLVAGVRQVQ